MTDDQLDSYADRLANSALVATRDPLRAATVLFQAAAAILFTKVGPKVAPEMLRELGQEIGDAFEASWGGETRQ